VRVKSILVGCCSLLAVGVLSACSGTSSHTPAPSGTASAVTSPSASTTPPAVTAPAGTTPPASTTVPVPHPAAADAPFSTAAPSAGVPACTSVTTRLTAEPQQPANRNGATLLHFTNISSHPCTTQGHPGVAVLNAAGQQQYQATREPAGYFGGLQPGQSPPLVSLSPGQEATAILEVGDVYPNGNFCPSAPALLVTMPGDTTSRTVTTKISDCGNAAIDPVLPGTTGSGSATRT